MTLLSLVQFERRILTARDLELLLVWVIRLPLSWRGLGKDDADRVWCRGYEEDVAGAGMFARFVYWGRRIPFSMSWWCLVKLVFGARWFHNLQLRNKNLLAAADCSSSSLCPHPGLFLNAEGNGQDKNLVKSLRYDSQFYKTGDQFLFSFFALFCGMFAADWSPFGSWSLRDVAAKHDMGVELFRLSNNRHTQLWLCRVEGEFFCPWKHILAFDNARKGVCDSLHVSWCLEAYHPM